MSRSSQMLHSPSGWAGGSSAGAPGSRPRAGARRRRASRSASNASHCTTGVSGSTGNVHPGAFLHVEHRPRRVGGCCTVRAPVSSHIEVAWWGHGDRRAEPRRHRLTRAPANARWVSPRPPDSPVGLWAHSEAATLADCRPVYSAAYAATNIVTETAANVKLHRVFRRRGRRGATTDGLFCQSAHMHKMRQYERSRRCTVRSTGRGCRRTRRGVQRRENAPAGARAALGGQNSAPWRSPWMAFSIALQLSAK